MNKWLGMFYDDNLSWINYKAHYIIHSTTWIPLKLWVIFSCESEFNDEVFERKSEWTKERHSQETWKGAAQSKEIIFVVWIFY